MKDRLLRFVSAVVAGFLVYIGFTHNRQLFLSGFMDEVPVPFFGNGFIGEALPLICGALFVVLAWVSLRK